MEQAGNIHTKKDQTSLESKQMIVKNTFNFWFHALGDCFKPYKDLWRLWMSYSVPCGVNP